MNFVFGAGGVAREVAWILHEVLSSTEAGNVITFVTTDSDPASGSRLDGHRVISESELASVQAPTPSCGYVAIGLPELKRRALASARRHSQCAFPALVHPRATMDRRFGKVVLGEGSIIYPNASLTTEVVIGAFVHINPLAAVAHQVRIGDFSTLCPGSVLSGNVAIGSGCFIGAGAIIREGVSIADDCVIGAGAVVVQSIEECGGTWIGVPARRLGI